MSTATQTDERYGGLSRNVEASHRDITREPTERVRAAIHGCTVGAALAFEEGSKHDHRIMMERIEDLSLELARRAS